MTNHNRVLPSGIRTMIMKSILKRQRIYYLNAVAETAVIERRFDDAAEDYRQLVGILDTRGYVKEAAALYCYRCGFSERLARQYVAAEAVLQRAAELYREAERTPGEFETELALCAFELARTAADRGDLPEAQARFAAAEPEFRRLVSGSVLLQAFLREYRDVLLALNRAEEAAALTDELKARKWPPLSQASEEEHRPSAGPCGYGSHYLCGLFDFVLEN